MYRVTSVKHLLLRVQVAAPDDAPFAADVLYGADVRGARGVQDMLYACPQRRAGGGGEFQSSFKYMSLIIYVD